MSDNTRIEWTDATWNPVTGCSVISAGCTNCYAMRLAGTRLRHHPTREGLTTESKAGPVWNGNVRFNASMIEQPLQWHRPRRIFVCAHGDLFHENVPDEWIDSVFAVMTLAHHHTFQVLTKRAARMRDYIASQPWLRINNACREWGEAGYKNAWQRAKEAGCYIQELPGMVNSWALPNVWLGVSVEDQKSADERVPLLLNTPAAVRWISAEPLLGEVNLVSAGSNRFPDWVVAGGESGPGSRPMNPEWVTSLQAQCMLRAVPFFFKQWGDWAPWQDHWPSAQGSRERLRACGLSHEEFSVWRVGKKMAGRI